MTVHERAHDQIITISASPFDHMFLVFFLSLQRSVYV